MIVSLINLKNLKMQMKFENYEICCARGRGTRPDKDASSRPQGVLAC
jgi:hypothetical protein